MTIEKVVIIIPVYNEASVIEDTLAQVFTCTQAIEDFAIHVLIFDSASTDGTQKIVSDLQKKNPLLHMKTESRKSGLGSAYLQAMQYAMTELSADIVIEFDADLSHQPKYIRPMLEKIKTQDVVLGSRYVPGGSIPADWGWNRKLLSVLGNWTARLLLTRKYKDFTSGFKVTRTQILKQVLPERFLSMQFAYKLELLWLLHKNKAAIGEFPIEFIDRTRGQSKLPANSVYDSLRVLLILRFKELKRYFKMCLVGVSGMAIQFLVYNLFRLRLPPFNAAQIAVAAAMINNFILNHRFTFRRNATHSRAGKAKSLVLFMMYSVLVIFLQSYWLRVGMQYIGSGYLRENMLIITGMFMGSLLNYLVYSRLVWRNKKD